MKRKVCFVAMALSLACITGCGNTVTEVSEENQKLVAEYAAGLLLKYNATGSSRILEGQKLTQEEAREAAEAEREQKRLQAAADYEASKGQKPEGSQSGNGNGNGGTGAGAEERYLEDMAPLFGFENFAIQYVDYEVTDSYPSDNREDMFMAMDATPGKKFLVAKFAVTNGGSESQDFDMFEKQGKFRLNIQGKSIGSQYTLLLDDLSVYKGEIEAGQAEEMVLIFEIPEALAENPGEMTLTVRCGDSRGNLLLQ